MLYSSGVRLVALRASSLRTSESRSLSLALGLRPRCAASRHPGNTYDSNGLRPSDPLRGSKLASLAVPLRGGSRILIPFSIPAGGGNRAIKVKWNIFDINFKFSFLDSFMNSRNSRKFSRISEFLKESKIGKFLILTGVYPSKLRFLGQNLRFWPS